MFFAILTIKLTTTRSRSKREENYEHLKTQYTARLAANSVYHVAANFVVKQKIKVLNRNICASRLSKREILV